VSEIKMNHTKEEQAIMSRIANLRKELKRQEVLLDAERLSRAGVAVGDIVISQGARFRVAKVHPYGWGKSAVTGNPTKKDGTFGGALRCLGGNWEKVSE
jgi:hypothetical protein